MRIEKVNPSNRYKLLIFNHQILKTYGEEEKSASDYWMCNDLNSCCLLGETFVESLLDSTLKINHRMRSFIVIVIISFSFSIGAVGQTFENLVFEGAGIRGLAYAGVVDELERRNLRSNVKRVGGTSAGAITALLFALGYTGKEMELIIAHTNYNKLNDGKWFFIGGLNRLHSRYGWYKGEAFSNYIGHLIEAKTGNADITFMEMKTAGYPEIYITGTCLNKQELTVFSYLNYPNMKLRDALRVSMSIPLYFEAVFLDEEGNLIKRPKHPEDFNLYVDGGITGNFPIWMFDEEDPISGKLTPNPKTLGIRIDTDEQLKNDAKNKALVAQNITSLDAYINALYIYVIENLNRPALSPVHWQNTISVSSGTVGPRIRKLSLEEKQTLFRNGQLAVRTFFANKPSSNQRVGFPY